MLSDIYPEYNWVPWKFLKTPKAIVNDPKFMVAMVDFLEKELLITHPGEWYRVSKIQLMDIGFIYQLNKCGGIIKILKEYRPDFPWDEKLFAFSK